MFDKLLESVQQANEEKIVKGGKSYHLPFGTYREGYDVVQGDNGKFFFQIMNGSVKIFKGPEADTEEEAEKLGIEKVKKENPTLAKNTGIGEKKVNEEGKVKESVDVMENLECPKCKAPLHLVNDVLYTGSRYDESKKIKEEKEDVFIDDYMQSRNYNHKLYDKLLSKLKVIHNQHKDQFPGLTFTIGMSAKYQTPYLLIKTDDKDYGKIGDIEGQIMDAIDDVGFSVGDIEEKSWGYEIKFSD